MIRLYAAETQDFSSNGIGTLPDAISCMVTEERNGEYELEMQYPMTGQHYSDIKNRCIIFCQPNPYKQEQPFRIYRLTRPINGIITIYAQHISYDLSGIPVSPFSASNIGGALTGLTEKAVVSCPFTFLTDKSTTAEFSVPVPSSVRSLLGGQSGSLLDVYGGEWEFDRFSAKLWTARGTDNGVSIRYGKNMTDLNQEENIASVATGVYPFWRSSGDDATVITLSEKILSAPGTYDFVRIVPLDLSAEFDNQPTEEQLRNRANAYMANNHIGIPKVSITVSFQPLGQTEEYKDMAVLETVRLCDTIYVYFEALGISASAKVVKTVYDVLLGQYSSISIGEPVSTIADTIAAQSSEIVKKPTVAEVRNAAAIASKLITGNSGGYVLIHSSTGGMPDEILILDTPDINTAVKVWRWNASGLGYSSTGYNGTFGLAMTIDGSIVADFIKTGELDSNIINTLELFAQNITMTGTFTTSAEMYLAPGLAERNTIRDDIQNISKIPADKISLYDFDNSGSISITDFVKCTAFIQGTEDFSNWSGAQKSTVTVTINISNPDQAIKISGVNMWGRTVETVFGWKPRFDPRWIYSQVDQNGISDNSVLTSYPVLPGVYRVGAPITGIPSESNGYGTLVIWSCGTYQMHLHVDGNLNFYWARSVGSAPENIEVPTYWFKASGTQQLSK